MNHLKERVKILSCTTSQIGIHIHDGAVLLHSLLSGEYYNPIQYDLVLNSSPLEGIEAGTKIVLTTKWIEEGIYSSKIGDMQSTRRSEMLNIYLLHSTGKLGRT